MSEKIYAVRYIELEPELAAKLWPFTQAWRPLEKADSWRELREQGLEPVEEESLMDVIVDQYEYDREIGV